MARRARAIKREVIPDAKYRSMTVSRLIMKIMERGQKRIAEKIVYDALDKLGQHVSKDPVAALEQAVKNATPLLQVKPRRVGGATYQVPVEVQPDRGLFLALSWLIQSARSRKGKPMHEKLADELAEAFQGQGNRAFAHYRW
jgi:small subunit ribosomal protein S7